MKLYDITQPETWDAFMAAQPFAQFLQSWVWGDFRASQKGTVRRIALVGDDGQWQAALQMEYRSRRFGMGYWFAPRGPVFSASLPFVARRDAMMSLCELLLVRKEMRSKTLFWRMEPVSELNAPEGLIPARFRRAHSLDPSSTMVLDLGPPEEDLLAKMHEKTRYNIRLAERKGVKTRLAKTPQDVDAFLDLMDVTASRDKFIQHSRSYLKATIDFLQERGMAQIRLAEWNGKILAANMETLYGDTMTYLYGASSSEDRNVMAPFALQWSAIQDAKLRGFRLYDFWGCNPQSKAMPDYKDSWEGITRFKQGWGGRLVNFVGTNDLPMNIFFYRMAFLRDFFRS